MYAAADPTDNQQQEYLHNWEAYQALGKERDRLSRQCFGIGFGSIVAAATILSSVCLAIGTSALAVTLTKLQKVSQAFLWLGKLLDEFGSHQVDIVPRIEVPENGQLDLFIRFPMPPKAVFAVAFRSQGNAVISYNQEKECLYVRYRNRSRGSKRWQPDHIERLAFQETWIRRNRDYLLGSSSRDRRRPCIKLLVLTGETKLAPHPEHLYVTIGDQKALLLQRRSSVYVLEEENLIPFIKAWLAQQGAQASKD